MRQLLKVYTLQSVEEEEFIKLSHFQQVLKLKKVFNIEEDDILEELLTDMLEQIDAIVVSSQGTKLIGLAKLIEALKALGYKDFEYPKARKNMNFQTLALKEQRVLNRLAKLTLSCMEGPL